MEIKVTRERIIKDLESLTSYETIEMEPIDFDRDKTKQQVIEEITYHLNGNSASELLINQLTELYGNGYVTILNKKHPYNKHYIYHDMEKIIKEEIQHKPFIREDSLLKGKNIFHSHHSKLFYMNYNFIQYFKRKYRTDDDVVQRISEIKKLNVVTENLFIYFIYEVMKDSIDKNDKKTGQWIIFQKVKDKINFICLYLHNDGDNNDEQLYLFIKDFLI